MKRGNSSTCYAVKAVQVVRVLFKYSFRSNDK